jgi:hypothetical protein
VSVIANEINAEWRAYSDNLFPSEMLNESPGSNWPIYGLALDQMATLYH